MFSDITKYKTDYSLLAILASAYLAFVVKFQTTPYYLVIGTGIFAFTYFLWGIFHHLKAKSLQGKVVLEYLLVAILAVVIVSTLLI